MVQVPQSSMEEKDSKLMDNCKFVINELVLCYEPDPLKAKMLYDAKVLDVDITKDDKSRKVYEYYIHFQGWNKSWDRWVLESQVLKVNDVNRKLQTKFHDDAINKKKRKQKSKHDSGDEDDKSVTSTGSGNSDERVSQRPLISVDIPKGLAARLEDDCYNIKRKKTLIHLPRKPSVNDIFNQYYKHCEKIIATPEGRCLTSLNIVYEVLQGLNTYFNYYLFTLLLYNFEREQYNSFFSEQFRNGPCESNQASLDLPSNDVTLRFPPTPNLSEASSRSNSRTSSICEDPTTGFSTPLLKEVLRTKSVRKRKGEGKALSVDDSSSCDCTGSKRSRKGSLPNPIVVSPGRTTPQAKTTPRERRTSSRYKVEEVQVYPKEEKAIKPMEILTENIIDYSRTTTRSRRYAPKGSPTDANGREHGKENEKESVKELSKEEKKDLSAPETPLHSSRTELSKDSAKIETPKSSDIKILSNSSETMTPSDQFKDTPRHLCKTDNRDTTTEMSKVRCVDEKVTKNQDDIDERGKKNFDQQLHVDVDDIQTGEGEIENEKPGTETNSIQSNITRGQAKETNCLNITETFNHGSSQLKSETLESTSSKVENEEKSILVDHNIGPAKEEEEKAPNETKADQSKDDLCGQDKATKIPKEIVASAKFEICLEDIIVGAKRDKTDEHDKTVNDQTGSKENKDEDQYIDDASSENGKFEKPYNISCLAESNGNRLRRSARSVKSTTVSESDEHEILPMGSTARTLQASYKSDQKTSVQGKLNDNETYMIFPVLENSDTPADLYGFEHLLRLFVKLPILLSSTNINEPRVGIILKIVRHLLEYLSKRSDLFVDMTSIYSESVI